MSLRTLPSHMFRRVAKRAVKSGWLPEGQAFLKLAMPLAAAQLAQFAVSFVDTIMMGRLGTESLASGGLAASTFQMALTVGTGFVVGSAGRSSVWCGLQVPNFGFSTVGIMAVLTNSGAVYGFAVEYDADFAFFAAACRGDGAGSAVF